MRSQDTVFKRIKKAINFKAKYVCLKGRSSKEKCTFLLYLKVNSIQGKATSDVETSKNVEFTQLDLEAFKEIREDPQTFK